MHTNLVSTAMLLALSACMASPGEFGGDENASAEPVNALEQNAAAAPIDTDAIQCQQRGMTWAWKSRVNDVDSVGSDATTNAYAGDTTCNVSLPILCIRKASIPKPGYVSTGFYNGWSGGYIALTHAHLGYDLGSQEQGNSICVQELGSGWQMAEFHDGAWGNGGSGGWNFQAFGAATNQQRFWAAIIDQAANCWNSACL